MCIAWKAANLICSLGRPQAWCMKREEHAEVVLLQESVPDNVTYFNVFLENLHCCKCSKSSTKLYSCLSLRAKVCVKLFVFCCGFLFYHISYLLFSTSIIIWDFLVCLLFLCHWGVHFNWGFCVDACIYFYFCVTHYVCRNKLNILLQV